MSDETLLSPVLPSTNAAVAYAADLTRLCRTGPVGVSDDAWLILAHALGRFEALSADQVAQSALQVADVIAIDALAAGQSSQEKLLRVARALRRLSDAGTVASGPDDIWAEIVLATQAVAEDEERAGAFELAYATLDGALRACGTRVAASVRGGVLAHQGRAVRQLGYMDFARSLYEAALVVGEECAAYDIVARAFLGLGILGVSRGNYPYAREQFAHALAQADRAHDPELIRNSHHGLMNCSIASGDLDAALVHGWSVLRLCISPDSRAEALMNLAEVCRLTGELETAIRVFAVAMEWTSNRSVKLHAASSALHVAASLGNEPEARRYLAEVTDSMPTVPDVYTQADVSVEVAESLHMLGDLTAADDIMNRASALASAHAFHEVAHRADRIRSGWTPAETQVPSKHTEQRRRRTVRSEDFRMVLRSLKGLTAAAL